jgi:hypothetical protein
MIIGAASFCKTPSSVARCVRCRIIRQALALFPDNAGPHDTIACSTMASSRETLPKKPRSFDPPEEPVWHRMIAESAYYLAERRGFQGGHSLDDWLEAEQQVRQMISPLLQSEATMDATRQDRPEPDAKANPQATKVAGDTREQGTPSQSKNSQGTAQQHGASRFEKFAATQAAGDGVQGDTLKKGQTADEKIGANMADRK